MIMKTARKDSGKVKGRSLLLSNFLLFRSNSDVVNTLSSHCKSFVNVSSNGSTDFKILRGTPFINLTVFVADTDVELAQGIA